MGNLDRERTCTVCGGTFRLADHAVTGALAVAQALDEESMRAETGPDIVRTCPKCMGTERGDHTEAKAEFFRLERETERAKKMQIPRDVKTIASGISFMGVSLLLGSLFVGFARGHSSLTWSGAIAGGVIAIGGVTIGAVAFARVYARRKPQL